MKLFSAPITRNKNLAKERANSIKKYLVSAHISKQNHARSEFEEATARSFKGKAKGRSAGTVSGSKGLGLPHAKGHNNHPGRSLALGCGKGKGVGRGRGQGQWHGYGQSSSHGGGHSGGHGGGHGRGQGGGHKIVWFT